MIEAREMLKSDIDLYTKNLKICKMSDRAIYEQLLATRIEELDKLEKGELRIKEVAQ